MSGYPYTGVAVLYCDPLGVYPKLLGPEFCWDEARDARTYAGPWPVICHPPCGAWGHLRHMRVPNRERRTQDASLGPVAFEQVRRWGGVLEQPAGSLLFAKCGAPAPGDLPDQWGGRSIKVEQVRWGHPARKATWLYLVGVNAVMHDPPAKAPTHWVSGGRKRSRKGRGGVVPPGIKVCSAQQRRRTPEAFARWLIELASQVKPRVGEGV